MDITRTTLTWVISFIAVLFALSLVSQLVEEVGPPILLDPEHKLEMPPPPQSMYQMGQEATTHPATQEDLDPQHSDEHSIPTLTPSLQDTPSRTHSLTDKNSDTQPELPTNVSNGRRHDDAQP
ncbi:MAG: hypothetical protein NPIRA04_22420 [Nitrospirales bacterium]|nr:MAG: hypothetical protein NPIRA04_22420 [Nitrospirales bacterium]